MMHPTHAPSVVDTVALGIDVPSEAIFETLEDTARGAVEEVAEQASHASVTATEPPSSTAPHTG